MPENASRRPATPEPDALTNPAPSTRAADVLLGVSFADPFRAEEFVLALRRMASNGNLVLRDIVVVVKDEEGRVRARESTDVQPGAAAVQGAMWSGLLGLLIAGPLGWVAGLGIGAGAGAITARVVDTGIPDEWVEWFKSAVQPLTATVVALVGDVDLGALNDEARRFHGGRLVHATLSAQSTAQLAESLGTGKFRSGDDTDRPVVPG
jgi:uncharacterized membrane protein